MLSQKEVVVRYPRNKTLFMIEFSGLMHHVVLIYHMEDMMNMQETPLREIKTNFDLRCLDMDGFHWYPTSFNEGGGIEIDIMTRLGYMMTGGIIVVGGGGGF